jgi:hypothetical protein
MKKEKYIAYLFAFLAIYYLIANFSIYKSFVAVAIAFVFVVIGYFYLPKRYKSKSYKEPLLYFSAWSFLYLWSFLISGEVIGFGYITILVYSVLFLSLNLDYQLTIAKFFIWGLSILCLCSATEYVIYLITGQGIVLGSATRTTVAQSTYFTHYIFNLILNGDHAIRFQGLADEAGRLGTLCGMLIFLIRKLEMSKWPFYIILMSGLLSFSLAFYVLLAIFLLSMSKSSLRNSLLAVCFVSVVLWLVQDQFNERILERISDTENIDNRTGEVFDVYFYAAVQSGQIWIGTGGDQITAIADYSGGGVGGAKVFLLQYGVICFVLIFIIYNFIYIRRCRGKVSNLDWLFLLAFWLSFYQRQTIFFPFTMIIFFVMPLAGNNIKKLSAIKKIEKNNIATKFA